MNAAETAKIDGYLFGEMNEADRDKFDQEMMTDDELFYDVAERENGKRERTLGHVWIGGGLTPPPDDALLHVGG